MRSGNREVRYEYGKNGEVLRVQDAAQGLSIRYEYDAVGREKARVYGNGVREERFYDRAGRVVLIKEANTAGELLRAEGYVYDEAGRRSRSVNGEGKVTEYEYDVRSRLKAVLYPWSEEKSAADRKEAEEAGLFFSNEKGRAENLSVKGADMARLRDWTLPHLVDTVKRLAHS
jgi:YD repeat-containing protein